jgi:hypothetical protein
MIAQYKLSQGIQTASESRTTTISPESKPYDSAANDTLPKEVAWGDVKGQVGVALELKERYSYLIFTGTTALKLPVGAKVEIVNNANRRIQGRIARSVDGYYSAVIDGDIHDLEVGDRIEVRGS